MTNEKMNETTTQESGAGPRPKKCNWCDGLSGHKIHWKSLNIRHGSCLRPMWLCGGCIDLYDEVDRLLEEDDS